MVKLGLEILLNQPIMAFSIGEMRHTKVIFLKQEKVVWIMEKRSAYLDKLEENLKEFNRKLDEIKVIAADAQDDLKAEYRSQVQDLETKRDNLVIKLGQLKEASGQAWDDLKVGTERTWSELKYTIEVALTHFK